MRRRNYRKNSTIEGKKEAMSRAWGFIEDEDDEIIASFGGLGIVLATSALTWYLIKD